MKLVPLYNGHFAKVDDEDYDKVMQYKWYKNNGYAIASSSLVKMHRFVMNAPDGLTVDHIDRDRLNNTKANLRVLSLAHNIHNCEKRSNTITRYKGVHKPKGKDYYQARCKMNKTQLYLGHFRTDHAAAIAYNRKASELSEYARLNKILIPISCEESYMNENRVRPKVGEKVSLVKGVVWNKSTGYWNCTVWDKGVKKKIFLGSFKKESDAIEKVTTHKLCS